MTNVSKNDFDELHKKVDKVSEDVSEIKGLLKGRKDAKSGNITLIGVVSAIVLGVWNMLK